MTGPGTPLSKPPHAGEETADVSRNQAIQSARVELVRGAAPQLDSETRRLLRVRLRGAASIFLMGTALFLARELMTGGVVQFLPPQTALPIILVVLMLTFGACVLLLWSRAPLSLTTLRIAELLIFGLPAPAILVIEHILISGPRASAWNVILTPVWLTLIFTYAMFIPNTWRRAALVTGTLVLLPLAAYFMHRTWIDDEPISNSLVRMSPSILLLLIGAIAAAYGTHLINSLRRQAFEARQFGQYVLKEPLGSGGMGEVYLAEHQLLKRPCAVKVIRPGRAADPAALERFEREVRATARLSHWNIVEIFDYGRTEEGTFYYAMEYLPGKTLGELVERHGPMPPERVIHLLRQTCDALREAHAQGLVHRDLKPGNIIAAQRGGVYDVVKIVDFGLVEAAGLAARPRTGLGQILGSPHYMSPEQALGQHEPDAASDIYSLGAVAYYLLTGHPPFDGKKPIKVLVGHACDEVVPPSHWRPEVPPDLEEIVLKCLAKNPLDRFTDAESLRDALAGCEGAYTWTRQCAARWWQEIEGADAPRRPAQR